MPRGRPFQSGNKFGRGRPRGSRNKRSRVAQRLLYEHSESLVRKAMVEALKGDAPLLRTLLPYVLPRWKDAPVLTGKLPTRTIADLSNAMDAILQRVSGGELTLQDGHTLADLISTKMSVLVNVELEDRVSKLEKAAAESSVDAVRTIRR